MPLMMPIQQHAPHHHVVHHQHQQHQQQQHHQQQQQQQHQQHQQLSPENGDIKHGKTCHHWATPGRACTRGQNCKFIHAWVNPKKTGVCRNHQLGKCFYSDNSCYFQHLRVPIDEYEALAQGTSSYAELSAKVEYHLRRRGTDKKQIQREKQQRFRRPSDITRQVYGPTSSFSRFSRAIGSERKHRYETKYDQKYLPMETPFSSRLARWQRENIMAPIGLARNDMTMPPTLQLPTVNPRALAAPTAESTTSDSDNEGSIASSSSGPAEKTVHLSKEMEGKSMKDWSVEEVYKFILALGNSACWRAYAEQLKKEHTDGATLIEYEDPQSLVEDFKDMKKGHARVISKAVKNHHVVNSRV